MYKFLVEKEKEQQFDVEKQFYHFADNSVYILIKYYKGGTLINQLFVKLLDDLTDYKKFFNNFYMKKGEVFFEPILLKASESLDIFSLAKASHRPSQIQDMGHESIPLHGRKCKMLFQRVRIHGWRIVNTFYFFNFWSFCLF